MRFLWMILLVVAAACLSADEQAPTGVVIQQEAHLLVESLKRRFPDVKFTFVLSNETELAAAVAQNLSRLQQIQRMETDLQDIRMTHRKAEEEGRRIQQEQALLQEELQVTMGKVRKLYLLLDDLQTQKKELSDEVEHLRKTRGQEQREKEVLVAEVAHYRGVVARIQQALEEVPEFIRPQRLFRSPQEQGTDAPTAISDSSRADLLQK